MAAELDSEPLDDDFVDYIARRFNEDRAVAEARLSEWLNLCLLGQMKRAGGRAVLAAEEPRSIDAYAASPPDLR